MIVIISAMPLHAATTRATTRAAESAAAARTANPASGYNYNYMYPYLNNQMKTVLNPGVTTSQSTSPINAVVKTEQLSTPRRVVARSATNTTTTTAARSATTTTTPSSSNSSSAARSATTGTTSGTTRRVVARSGTSTTTAATTTRAGTRADSSYITRTAANAANAVESTTETLSASRCLADYTECMNGYCQRENTKYNRCYCSAKLSQIDAEYQTQIDSLIKQILTIQGTNQWSDAEMNEYWMSTIGKYTGDNSWVNLDNALDIDWASLESRVRGQQAFATGHEYCVQHLRGCYYMAANMRDAYRSEIARDCTTYEQALQKLKNAAESIIEANK